MDLDEHIAPDWKDAAAYAPLLDADRSIIAWEWLRRDPAYRTAARTAFSASGASERSVRSQDWGLHAFERPERAAPEARPIWGADYHPYVLQSVAVEQPAPSDAFDLASLGPLATLVRAAAGSEHLLVSDGLRAIRLDVLAGSLERGPVQLEYLLSGFASVEKPLLTLRRLMALRQGGRFSRSLHTSEPRTKRWVLLLRAFDGLAAGAAQREVAASLLSRSAGEPRWRSRASSIRSQVQRLVRNARAMAAGGYLELLR